MSEQEFDVVIVGGGSAGCVLAARVSEQPSLRVLLIEAGADTPPGQVPAEVLDTQLVGAPLLLGDRFIWPNFEVNFAVQGNPPYVRRGLYEQGRVLGGGSSVNVMAANRGLPRDYDGWAQNGADGWGWSDMLPYFNKLEHDLEFDGPLHGKTGPIPITRASYDSWPPFIERAASGLKQLGFRDIGDQNGRFEDGYFRPGQSCENKQRVSTAIGYLTTEVRGRPNLAILTDAHVEEILFDGKRAVGVAVSQNGAIKKIRARREVVLAAGALQSPALLLRAGIGPARDLQTLGIPVLADRPGVGANLMDHTATFLFSPIPRDQAISPIPDSRHHIGVRLSSGVEAGVPSDLYLVINAGLEPAVAGSFGLWINHPSSRGRVTLHDRSPRSYPDVDFQLLSDSRDFERLKAGFRFISALTRADGLNELQMTLLGIPARTQFAHANPQPPAPLPLAALLEDDAALHGFVRRTAKGLWHASGTARIGAAGDPNAVTDTHGRVFGVSGLRVGDASLFPTIPTANTNLPTIAVAEKIAATLVSDLR